LPGSEQRERAEVVNGRNYRVQRLVGYRLIPLQAGARVLPDVSMTIELSSVTRRRGSFFNRQQLVPWGEINAQSESFPLVVKALSEQGRPKVFPKTSVGETTLSARVAQRSIRADSGVDLTIETKTTGLLENFPLIELNELKDFEVYPGQVRTVDGSSTASRSGRTPSPRAQWSRRVQSFLLRPKTSGQLTVPSVRLAYFDPSRGRYSEARTKSIRIRVRGKVPRRESNKMDESGRERVTQRAEFRPLSKSESQTPPLDWSDSIALFYLSLLGFPCAVVVWLLIERGRSSRARNSGDRNAARALKNAKRALGLIGRATDKNLRDRAKSAKGAALEYLVQ
jgi:hypothetical protein